MSQKDASRCVGPMSLFNKIPSLRRIIITLRRNRIKKCIDHKNAIVEPNMTKLQQNYNQIV